VNNKQESLQAKNLSSEKPFQVASNSSRNCRRKQLKGEIWSVAHLKNVLTQGTQFSLFLLQIPQSIAMVSVTGWREVEGTVLRVRHTQCPAKVRNRSKYITQYKSHSSYCQHKLQFVTLLLCLIFSTKLILVHSRILCSRWSIVMFIIVGISRYPVVPATVSYCSLKKQLNEFEIPGVWI
jgi:hypothetical protein